MRAILILLLTLMTSAEGFGWVYPEHRSILLLAIENLDKENRGILDKLWAEARLGYTERLTETIIDPAQTIHPAKLDYASWAAIAGDHSCSPSNMLDIVLKSDWILDVAHVAAKLKIDLEAKKRPSDHVNALRDSDLKLQDADSEYATRAGSNNVHFLQARKSVETTGREYLFSCHKPGAELNAVGVYSWFHSSAIYKLNSLRQKETPQEQRSAIILSALADEAFALHFLEDVYASGHTAGTWGETSVRKGTHDYYNEKGLEVVTWSGVHRILLGDAYMRQEDAEFAAANVKLSLQQITAAFTGSLREVPPTYGGQINLPDTFNVCKNNLMPAWEKMTRDKDGMAEGFDFLPQVLAQTPVPGLATGTGEIPRFRSELGMFLGVSSSLNLSAISGGFGSTQTDKGFIGGIEANVRFGLGLDGVLNESGDGLVFFQLGLRQDASSSHRFVESDNPVPAGALTAAIPGRAALDMRLRLPFWVLPGDLLVLGPIVYLISPNAATQMGVDAVNGGLIPWQAGMQTSFGRFQFILGREVGVSFYGTKWLKNDAILLPTPGGTSQMVSYSSTKFDFPFLEYRPFRTFSLNQSSSLMVQFTFGFDIPHDVKVEIPAGDPDPQLRTVWHLGARLVFDWRRYF